MEKGAWWMAPEIPPTGDPKCAQQKQQMPSGILSEAGRIRPGHVSLSLSLHIDSLKLIGSPFN